MYYIQNVDGLFWDGEDWTDDVIGWFPLENLIRGLQMLNEKDSKACPEINYGFFK